MRRAIEVQQELHGDEVFRRVADIQDFIAAEVKYHGTCRSAYVSSANYAQITSSGPSSAPGSDTIYDKCFSDLAAEVQDKVVTHKLALEMSYLLEKFRESLLSSGMDDKETESYRSTKLKRRLIRQFGNKITFQMQFDRSKSELLYSSEISVRDSINTAAKMQENYNDESLFDNSTVSETKSHTLLRASQILQNDIKNCKGIYVTPLNSAEVSEETAYNMIPKDLYVFLKWIIEGYNSTVPIHVYENIKSSNSHTHRTILSCAQDILFAASQSRCRTPKHIGLATAVKHISGSKHLVTLLHHAGHAVSYDDIQRIDTSTAEHIMHKSNNGIIVPTNIKAGTFFHAAADNVVSNEDTLDGRNTTHSTSMVLYQSTYNIPQQNKNLQSADHRPKTRN